jgi:hypothetical protein
VKEIAGANYHVVQDSTPYGAWDEVSAPSLHCFETSGSNSDPSGNRRTNQRSIVQCAINACNERTSWKAPISLIHKSHLQVRFGYRPGSMSYSNIFNYRASPEYPGPGPRSPSLSSTCSSINSQSVGDQAHQSRIPVFLNTSAACRQCQCIILLGPVYRHLTLSLPCRSKDQMASCN